MMYGGACGHTRPLVCHERQAVQADGPYLSHADRTISAGCSGQLLDYSQGEAPVVTAVMAGLSTCISIIMSLPTHFV